MSHPASFFANDATLYSARSLLHTAWQRRVWAKPDRTRYAATQRAHWRKAVHRLVRQLARCRRTTSLRQGSRIRDSGSSQKQGSGVSSLLNPESLILIYLVSY